MIDARAECAPREPRRFRSLLVVTFTVCLAALGCGPGGPADTRVELREATLQPGASGGLGLERTWDGVQLPSAESPMAAVMMHPDGGGAVVRFRVLQRPGAPNGGLLRDMVFDRHEVGVTSPQLVMHSPEALCQATDCPTPIRAEMTLPALLRDEGLLVGARLMSWGAPFEPRHRLLRFNRGGALEWSSPISAEAIADAAAVAELADGTLAVAYSVSAGQSSKGVEVELRSANGTRLTTTLLATTDIADSGAGLPATGVPLVSKLVPSRDGGFFAVGFRALNRGIACGSQDAPRKPETVLCGQSVTHALLVKYDGKGVEQWRREFGQDFESPGSFFVDLVELEDGSLFASGHIEKRTNTWLQPNHGALVARLSKSGTLLRATRLCPCLGFQAGGAESVVTNLRAAGGGTVDALYQFRRSSTLNRTVIRLDSNDELIAAEPMPAARFVLTTTSGWAYWSDTAPEEFNLVRFKVP